MKTPILLTTMTVVTLLTTSCGGSKQTDNTPFDTADLTWAGLTGHVKECVVQSFAAKEEGESRVKEGPALTTRTITFNEEGLLTSDQECTPDYTGPKYIFTTDSEMKTTAKVDGDESRTATLTRDGDGRIIELTNRSTVDPEYDDMQLSLVYTWVNGRVAKHSYNGWEWGADERFTFDDQGQCTNSLIESIDLGAGSDTDKEYTYLSTDEQGNWTSREVTVTTRNWEESPIDNERTYSSPEVSRFIETRTISYY